MDNASSTQQSPSFWDEEDAASSEAAASKPKKLASAVLILDDSKAQRLVLQSFFSEWGYKVLEAGNGLEGIDWLNRDETVGLILADWKMPVMDGLEFMRAVRASPGFEMLPIIMMSGQNTLDQIRRGLQAGASDYLMKPFTKDDLIAKLDANGIEPR